jgi:hypothetical protein
MAKGTREWAMPQTTSLMVPSPPQTITKSTPASTARAAKDCASPRFVVTQVTVEVPALLKSR